MNPLPLSFTLILDVVDFLVQLSLLFINGVKALRLPCGCSVSKRLCSCRNSLVLQMRHKLDVHYMGAHNKNERAGEKREKTISLGGRTLLGKVHHVRLDGTVVRRFCHVITGLDRRPPRSQESGPT